MPLFGRKKQEEPKMPAELPPLSVLDQIPMMPQPEPKAMPPVMKREPEKATYAPLFVKIDRYRQTLTTIGNLKTSLMIIRNSMGTLNQIERVRDDTFGIINDLIEKMSDKLMTLDNDLLRPAGFPESSEISPEYNDVRSIEATVADLRGQIDQLKTELEKMA
ncbi:MAG: hypothetical protein HYW24_01035 [Candidatus Aenigmarchaeota archaeon]|nr:hypothetical protein [Candidatus Aenigmarchaeota archaeon]